RKNIPKMGYGGQLPFQAQCTAIGEDGEQVFIKTGTVFARLIASRAGVGYEPVAGQPEALAFCPVQEAEPDALLGVEADVVIILPGVEVFCPQPHDGVGALLQVLVAHGDVQYGELSRLVVFAAAVVEVDGAVFFEGNVTQPIRKGVAGGDPMVAGRGRNGADGGIGVEAKVGGAG